MKPENLKDLKKNYLKKIRLIKKYNEAYYNQSNPIVDDAIYDKLKKDIIEIEKIFFKNPQGISFKCYWF